MYRDIFTRHSCYLNSPKIPSLSTNSHIKKNLQVNYSVYTLLILINRTNPNKFQRTTFSPNVFTTQLI